MSKRNGYEMSSLMSAYNFAKHWGKSSGLFDSARVDRALSYLMSGECDDAWEKYATHGSGREWSCECPDRQYRGSFCKHIISRMVSVKYSEIETAKIAA